MNSKLVIALVFIFSLTIHASEHGIFLLTNKMVKGNIEDVSNNIASSLSAVGYDVLYNDYVKSPDYVREDPEEHCGFKAKIIVLNNKKYVDMLTSYSSKYLVASFIRVGIYENSEGLNVNIIDPETINRIVFNDLYDNDEIEKYNEVISKTKSFKTELVNILHETLDGEDLQIAMEPIRDDEDLAEASKDMFMMVGPLTLFTDEDQFPKIYSQKNTDAWKGLKNFSEQLENNLKNYQPTEDDRDYRWYPNEDDLKWKVVSKIESPEANAILLGLSRARTEAVSFNIAGSSREDETNMCPGIDHAAAYPIEILLIQEGENISVYTQREMHRMDMYFWDAGMSAFMDHMSMPGILDESIKRALLGKLYVED